jgi:hypothetical protein
MVHATEALALNDAILKRREANDGSNGRPYIESASRAHHDQLLSPNSDQHWAGQTSRRRTDLRPTLNLDFIPPVSAPQVVCPVPRSSRPDQPGRGRASVAVA